MLGPNSRVYELVHLDDVRPMARIQAYGAAPENDSWNNALARIATAELDMCNWS